MCDGASSYWSMIVTDDMSKALLIQRTNLSANLASKSLTVNYYPVGNQIRGITAPLGATKPSDMTDHECFVFDKVRALSSCSTRDKYRSFLLFLTGSTVQVFSSDMITIPAGANMRSLTSIWQRSRHSARIAGVSYSLSTITRDFAPSLVTARRTVTAPTPSLLACWYMNVLELRMASRKLSHSTTVFRPLPARLLTPPPSSMCFLIA